MEDHGSTKKNVRSLRSLLIEPFSQITFGLYVIGACLGFILVAGALFVSSFVEQYKHVLSLFNVVDPNLRWDFIIDDVFYNNIIRLSICFFLFLLLMFFMIFKLTHRYYGPIVAITRFIEDLKSGHYENRVKLRKSDELQSLAKHLNELAATLEKQEKSHKSSGDLREN